MYNFGILTNRPTTFNLEDADGEPFLDGDGKPMTVTVMAFYDAAGTEWHDAYKAQQTFDFYVALDAQGRVISMEADPEHSQIAGSQILGISTAEAGGLTNGPGGTAYGATWGGAWLAAPAVSQFLPLDPVDFKLGMMSLNITPDMVDAAIAALSEPDRTVASIYWTSARQFYRDDPWLALIAATFNKTDAEIDGAWSYAMSLTVSP